MGDLVRPVIFDALVEEFGFGPLVPTEPLSTFQALPVVEPKTEPFLAVTGPFPAVEVDACL